MPSGQKEAAHRTMMKPATVVTKPNQASRAQTASSKNRNTAIKTSTLQAEARRNYKPPPSASKKVATKEAKQAEKRLDLERERSTDTALLQA